MAILYHRIKCCQFGKEFVNFYKNHAINQKDNFGLIRFKFE